MRLSAHRTIVPMPNSEHRHEPAELPQTDALKEEETAQQDTY